MLKLTLIFCFLVLACHGQKLSSKFLLRKYEGIVDENKLGSELGLQLAPKQRFVEGPEDGPEDGPEEESDSAPITTTDAVTEASTTTTTANPVETNAYYVYTVDNMRAPVYMLATAESIAASPILATRRTIILVHGQGGSAFTSLNPVVRDAIFMVEDLNVIVADWSIYSSLSYSIAVSTVPQVAENLAALIELLVTEGKVTLSELHLVGFDLGAHVVGITGRQLNGRVGRITGLDPSGNQWDSNSARLRITDALYVEVVHTDGRGLLANGIGTALGNVDFFANGGSSQPGCITHSCCHDRAFELFAASMINPGLVGYPCSSNTQLNLNLCRGLPLKMGGTELTKPGAGIYRINTRRNFPF